LLFSGGIRRSSYNRDIQLVIEATSLSKTTLYISVLYHSAIYPNVESLKNKMSSLILVITAVLYCSIFVDCQQIVTGLNQRLEEFQGCEVLVVNAKDKDIHLKPTRFPILYFTEFKTYDIVQNKTIPWSKRLPYDPRKIAMFKYSELICQLHLYIFSRHPKPIQFEYSHFSFIVLLVNDSSVQRKDYADRLEIWANLYYLIPRLLFLWTFEYTFLVNGSQNISLRSIYYVCQFCDSRPKFWPSKVISGQSREHMELAAKQLKESIVWNPHQNTEAAYCTAEITLSGLGGESQFGNTFRKRLARGVPKSVSLLFTPFVKNIIYPKNLSRSLQFKKLYGGTPYVPILCFGDISGYSQRVIFKVIHFYSHWDGYNFITSYTEEDSFWKAGMVFIKPFQWQVWLALGAAICSTFMTLVVGKYIIRAIKIHIMSNFSSFILSLFEIGTSDEQYNIIQSRLMLKILFATWLLTAIVLTNAYKGIIISLLCAPFTTVRQLRYFSELDNFTHYTPSYTTDTVSKEMCDPDTYMCVSQDWRTRYNFTALQKKNCNKINLYYSFLATLLLRFVPVLTQQQQMIAKRMINSTYVFPQCKILDLIRRMKNVKRSAYVAWDSEIDEFLRVLNNGSNEKMFYKGQDQFFQMHRYWFIADVPYNLPLFRLSQLVASGIYEHLKYWLHDVGRMAEPVDDELAPISTNHNLFFIFRVLVFGCAVASISFVLERVKPLLVRLTKERSDAKYLYIKRTKQSSNNRGKILA